MFGLKKTWSPTENLKTSEGANRILAFSIDRFQKAFSADFHFKSSHQHSITRLHDVFCNISNSTAPLTEIQFK